MQLRAFCVRGLLHLFHALFLLALAFIMAGCGPGETSPGTGLPAGSAACPPGEMLLEGGGCQPAGLPPDAWKPCPPGETPLDAGGCQPAGVPPNGCGQGFVYDGQGGCNPILPPDPCPPGQMAIPGETQCRDVALCGTGDYGLIPIDATTQFVNAAYLGNDSDGTQAKPWKRIADGILWAKSGAVVAVAAGSYKEDLWIHWRPVRLWGRCPTLVEVVGTGTPPALQITTGSANHSEVHSLAITGPGPNAAILASGVTDVLIDRVWIHDTGGRGISVPDTIGPASITVSASLIEATTRQGVRVSGANATMEATVVRNTQPASDGTFGWGIGIEYAAGTSSRANVTLRNSLVERNHGIGVFVEGSGATMEATVVRNTQPASDGTGGSGIAVQSEPITHERSNLILRTSLLAQNHDMGVYISGSDATMEATVVRATQPDSAGAGGRGINVQSSPTTHERSTLVLRTSLLEQNHEIGLFVQGSDATMEATIVRATQLSGDGLTGRGISVQAEATTHEGSTLMLRTSLLEQNHEIGLFVEGSDATVEATVVRATQPRGDGMTGRGISVVAEPTTHERSTLTLRTSLLEQNHDVGLVVTGSDVTAEATVVRATQPLSDGMWGRGISVQSHPHTAERSRLTLRSLLLEQNHEAGLVILGSDATIEGTVVRATEARGDGTAGDGIGVDAGEFDNSPAKVAITSSQIESNARAGISNFNSEIILIGSRVRCNKIDLDGEDTLPGPPFTFDGSKDNLCGCADKPDPTCPVRSSNLSPPEPIATP